MKIVEVLRDHSREGIEGYHLEFESTARTFHPLRLLLHLCQA